MRQVGLMIIWLLAASLFGAVNPAAVDFDGSLTIDLGDVLHFAPAWLSHGGPSDDWNGACDLSDPPDGVIDAADLAVLADDWLRVFASPADFVNAADVTADRKVDFHDFAVFAAAWGAAAAADHWNPACDLADPPDGVIDVNDLMVLAANWLVRVPTEALWHYGADINHDRIVNGPDFAALSAAWLSDDRPTAHWNIDCDVAMPRDGRVDVRDLAAMTEQWLGTVPDPNAVSDAADINGDNVVDLADYAVMAAAWLADDTPMPSWNAACDVVEPNDGRVNGIDFAALSRLWGFTIPDPNLFAFIPGGEFSMGAHQDPIYAAKPVHPVRLDAFYLSRYQLTNGRYCAFLNDALAAGRITVEAPDEISFVYLTDDTAYKAPLMRPYNPPHEQSNAIEYADGVFSVRIKEGTIDMTDHPALTSWYGAAAYCNWLSEQQGRAPCYETATWHCALSAGGYRLATEAEWEYAARGGLAGKRYPWGDTLDGSMANYEDSGDPFEDPSRIRPYPYTTPVGYYNGTQTPAGVDRANGYGLYDMAGNVFEWCNDWYSGHYYQACKDAGTVVNPAGPAEGTSRVMRGGSWNITRDSKACQVDFRDSQRAHQPQDVSGSYGFRVCLPLP